MNKPEFKFDSVQSSHAAIVDKSPESNPAAMEAHAEAEAGELRDKGRQTDRAGTIFNPDLHAVNKEGEPSLTPTGKFRKRRSSTVATRTAQEITVQNEAAARATGQLCADMIIGGAVQFLGPEWIPIGESGEQEPMKFDEHSNLRRAFGDYFVAKQIYDFPPGIMLTVAMSSYVGARVAGGKETQSKIAKAKTWFGNLFRKVKGKKKDAARDNTRDNGVREDDSSQTNSGPIVSD